MVCSSKEREDVTGQMLAEWLFQAGTEDMVRVRVLALKTRGQWGGAGVNPVLSDPPTVAAVIGAVEEGFVGLGCRGNLVCLREVVVGASWRRWHQAERWGHPAWKGVHV